LLRYLRSIRFVALPDNEAAMNQDTARVAYLQAAATLCAGMEDVAHNIKIHTQAGNMRPLANIVVAMAQELEAAAKDKHWFSSP